jgi:xylan 1,4-beta-xylosidase
VPFVTLSFFPRAVSDSPVTPPRDLSAWAELVQTFLHDCVSKFSAAEVGRWRLEVWNEPNFPPFWRSDFDQYLKLYRVTSDAVSRTGYTVRLGGPALVYTPDSDGAALMEAFLRFLAAEPAMQCTFISYHHRKGAWFLTRTPRGSAACKPRHRRLPSPSCVWLLAESVGWS